MIRKFTKKAAIYTVAVMLGISIPVSSFTGVNTVITAEAATAKPKISNKTRSVYVGETTKVSLKNVSKNVKWKTSNKKVAAIKVNGTEVTITGKKAGKAVVSATYNKKNYKCTVTVKNKLVSISEKKKSLVVGNSVELTLKNGGSGTKWSTSKKSVASIRANGNKVVITGKKAGKATVTAKVGKKNYKCTVTVKNSPKISNKTREIKVGTATDVDITGVSSKPKVTIGNEDIVSVSLRDYEDVGTRSYMIKGKKAGKTTITFNVHGKTLKCTVTVKEKASNTTSEETKQDTSFIGDTSNYNKNYVGPFHPKDVKEEVVNGKVYKWVGDVSYTINYAGFIPIELGNSSAHCRELEVEVGKRGANAINAVMNVLINPKDVSWVIEDSSVCDIFFYESRNKEAESKGYGSCNMVVVGKKLGTTKVHLSYKGLTWDVDVNVKNTDKYTSTTDWYCTLCGRDNPYVE